MEFKTQHKPYSFIKLLSILLISSFFLVQCQNENKQYEIQGAGTTTYIPIDSAHASLDSITQTEIRPFKNHVDSMMNVELGFSDKEYFKKKPNGLLNNLSADMVLKMTQKKCGRIKIYP